MKIYFESSAGGPFHAAMTEPSRPALWWMWNSECEVGVWVTETGRMHGISYWRPESQFVQEKMRALPGLLPGMLDPDLLVDEGL